MIPIYRAKKIDGDDWVEGHYIDAIEHLYHGHLKGQYILNTEKGYSHTIQIDPNTLAIHFPNMIDKNGKKIFASLSEDGVGGDMISDEVEFDMVIVFDGKLGARIKYLSFNGEHFSQLDRHEVIGIHKGEESCK